MAESELPNDLNLWIEETADGRLIQATRRPGGARREAWYVDIEKKNGEVEELFLRLDRSLRSETGDPYSSLRETEVYLALQNTSVPVPAIHGVLKSPQAVLSDRIGGDTWFSQIQDPDEQLSVAQDFMHHLAALHRIDPHSLDIPALGSVPTARESALREIDAWENLYQAAQAGPHPLIEFSLRWARQNIPDYEGPVVLVQGDTGPGNFLYAEGKVTTILDWELAHWSDPMDDIAWLSLRAVQEPFTHLPDRLREYEQLSGHPLDEKRIRFYQIMAELRIAIMGHQEMKHRSSDREVGNGLIFGALHERLLVECLAKSIDLKLDPPKPPLPLETDRSWLYDAALDQIRSVIVPKSEDPFVILRAKGIARILKHLRDADSMGQEFEAQEKADLETLIGEHFEDAAQGQSVLVDRMRDGSLPAQALIHFFYRKAMRRTELVRSASGALAERHYPALF